MITLAFYKGLATDPWHRLQDAGIRFATRGRYSHVEFIDIPVDFVLDIGRPVYCLSSSGRAPVPGMTTPACCCRMFWRSVAMMKTGGSVRKSSPPRLAFRTRSACRRSCCSMWSRGVTSKP